MMANTSRPKFLFFQILSVLSIYNCISWSQQALCLAGFESVSDCNSSATLLVQTQWLAIKRNNNTVSVSFHCHAKLVLCTLEPYVPYMSSSTTSLEMKNKKEDRNSGSGTQFQGPSLSCSFRETNLGTRLEVSQELLAVITVEPTGKDSFV